MLWQWGQNKLSPNREVGTYMDQLEVIFDAVHIYIILLENIFLFQVYDWERVILKSAHGNLCFREWTKRILSNIRLCSVVPLQQIVSTTLGYIGRYITVRVLVQHRLHLCQIPVLHIYSKGNVEESTLCCKKTKKHIVGIYLLHFTCIMYQGGPLKYFLPI